MNSISRVNNDGEEADEEDDEGIDLNKDVDDDDDGVTLYFLILTNMNNTC